MHPANAEWLLRALDLPRQPSANEIHTRRGRKQRDRRRVDNLKQIKTKGMCGGGKSKKTGDGEMPRAARFPGEKQIARHFVELVASATDVIPRSSAAFVTATTSS